MTASELMHGNDWSGFNPTGWLIEEKFDGVRSLWTGREFISRNGNSFNAPGWFKAGLPTTPLDGELYGGPGTLRRTAGIVRSHEGGEHWRTLRFMVFDAPTIQQPYAVRLATAATVIAGLEFAALVGATVCESEEHLRGEFRAVKSRGGEGVVLHNPKKFYGAGRTQGCVVKVKAMPR